MAAADVNDDSEINSDLELKGVIDYAQKHWGLTIVEEEDESSNAHKSTGMGTHHHRRRPCIVHKP